MRSSKGEPERNHPIKVLIVTSTFPVSDDDGRPAFVLDLARSLAESHSVTVLAPRVGGVTENDWPDITVVRFRYFLRRWEGLADDAIMPTLRSTPRRWIEVPFFMFALIWSTLRLCIKTRPDVVNAHWIVPGGLAAWLVNRLTGTPYVVTVHGADAHSLDTAAGRLIKRLVLRKARASLPVSETARSAILSLDRRLQTTVTSPVPMGVAPRETDTRHRQAGDFVFVGRLAEKKGVSTALRALAATPHASLTVVGSGPELGRIKETIARLGLRDRVQLTGGVDRAAVYRYLSSSIGVIIPSVVAADGDQDGTPVVLAEAMASGTPVIASAIAGLTEHVVNGETGLLFRPGDDSALAKHMSWALANPDIFRKMGERARSQFEGSPLDMRETARAYARVLGPTPT